MKKFLLVAPLLGSFVLTGCSTTPDLVPEPPTADEWVAPSATTDPASAKTTIKSASSKKSNQEWADEKLSQWVDAMNEGWEDVVIDIHRPSDFLKWYPTDPHGHIKSFEAPEYGKLLITLEKYDWETDAASDLAYVSSNTMLRVGEKDPDLKSVTVVTEDGKHTGTSVRREYFADSDG